ncbi:hypothetical protein ACSS6N_04945 [Peribacillus frigoritolerans]|uniref:hypothetical protein n=1 Tax=Peribacillus frigoritolerans TaxID=450367 RepID=UPI003F843877
MKDNARSTGQESLYGLLLVNASNTSTMATLPNGFPPLYGGISRSIPFFMMMGDDGFSLFQAADHIIVYFP